MASRRRFSRALAFTALAAAVVVPGAAPTNGSPVPTTPEAVPAAGAAGDVFVSLDPVRVLDTRNGIGAPVSSVGPNGTLRLVLAGRGGVPATGVTAVALNVTAVDPTEPSYVTAWPSGGARPETSNLNMAPGTNTANVVISKLGADGSITLYNNRGDTHLLADVTGYFRSSASYIALDPVRVLDTRNGIGAPAARVGPRGTLRLVLAGRGGIPATGVTAVALNLTAVDPTATSYVTAWPSGTAQPQTSSLNTSPGTNAPNMVIAKLGADGSITLYNDGGDTHLLADVTGYFTGADSYVALDPSRALDTRNGIGAPIASVGPNSSLRLVLAGRGGVPASGVTAVALNLTAVDPTARSYLTAWPSGIAQPETSNLNTIPGRNTPNLVIAKLGADGAITIYNHSGDTHLLADVAGYFAGDGGLPAGGFTFAVIPDTQDEAYTTADRRMPKRLAWLLANRSALDLRWVLHSGDVHSWDTPDHDQYVNMSSYFQALNQAGLPYQLAAGNHDTGAVCPGGSACPGADASVTIRDTKTWNAFYPPQRFGLEGTFEPGKSENGWTTFVAGGKRWLTLSLELYPRTSVIQWAAGVVANHPHHNVIVVTHSFMTGSGQVSGSNGGYGANSGAAIWAALDDYPNVMMVFSGHEGQAASGMLPTADGHRAVGFLQTFHDPRYNPTRLVRVDPTTGTVTTWIENTWDRTTGQDVDVEYTQYRTTVTGMTFVD